MRRRRILVPLVMAGAIAGAAPSAVAAQPDNPGCFGEAVSFGRPAADPNAFGQEVSVAAREFQFGQEVVPSFKAFVCG
jgi:hypothetical protein